MHAPDPAFFFREGADISSGFASLSPELCTNTAALSELVQGLPDTAAGLRQSLCESRGGDYRQSFVNKLRKDETKDCRCSDGPQIFPEAGIPGDKSEYGNGSLDPLKSPPQRSCKPVLEREPTNLDKAVRLALGGNVSYSPEQFASLLPILQGKAPQLAQICDLYVASWKKLKAAKELDALKAQPPVTSKMDGEQYVHCSIAEVDGEMIAAYGLPQTLAGEFVIVRGSREKSAGFAPADNFDLQPYSKYQPSSSFEKALATLKTSLDCNNMAEVLGGTTEASVAAIGAEQSAK